jgi:hypothetical protein
MKAMFADPEEAEFLRRLEMSWEVLRTEGTTDVSEERNEYVEGRGVSEVINEQEADRPIICPWTSKMEAVRLSETSMNLQQTIWRRFPEAVVIIETLLSFKLLGVR